VQDNGNFNNSAFTSKPIITAAKAAPTKKDFFSDSDEDDFKPPVKAAPAQEVFRTT
jgi:hypothetical protein